MYGQSRTETRQHNLGLGQLQEGGNQLMGLTVLS